MTFQWPEMLWLLAAAPLLAIAYVLVLRRKKKAALRYASLGLIREALGPWHALRRHLPPALFLTALVAMLIATARPSAVVTLPTQQETVILAMDVSGSMRATDVEPNRLVASQNAAKAFVADMPPSTRIGVVSFAGTASVVQPPTRSREDIVAAIDRFALQRATAIGHGIARTTEDKLEGARRIRLDVVALQRERVSAGPIRPRDGRERHLVAGPAQHHLVAVAEIGYSSLHVGVRANASPEAFLEDPLRLRQLVLGRIVGERR